MVNAPEPNPPVETSAYEVPIGSIQLDDGKELKIFPKSPSTNFDQAKPFSIQRIFSISRNNQNPFYDPSSKILSFQVNSPNLLQQQLADAKNSVIQHYTPSNGGTTIEENDIFLRPLTISSYEISLDILGDNYLIEAGFSENGPFTTPIIIAKEIENERAHTLLLDNPSLVTIKLRIFSLFRLDNVNTVTASKFTNASKQAYEKVFGSRSSGRNYIVDREVAQELKQAFLEQITYVENISLPGADTSNLTNFVAQYIDNLVPTEISELESLSDSIIVYGTEEIKEEIKPIEYRNLTSSWEKHEDVKKSVEETWDNLSDISREDISIDKFHEKIREYLETSGGAKAKANILKLGSGGTSFNLHYKKEYERLTDTEKEDIERSRNILKESGSQKEEFLRKAVEKWTGEMYEEGTLVKNLNLVRIVYGELVNKLVVSAQSIIFQDVQAKAKRWEFNFPSESLEPNYTKLLESLSLTDIATRSDFFGPIVAANVERGREGPGFVGWETDYFPDYDYGKKIEFDSAVDAVILVLRNDEDETDEDPSLDISDLLFLNPSNANSLEAYDWGLSSSIKAKLTPLTLEIGLRSELVYPTFKINIYYFSSNLDMSSTANTFISKLLKIISHPDQLIVNGNFEVSGPFKIINLNQDEGEVEYIFDLPASGHRNQRTLRILIINNYQVSIPSSNIFVTLPDNTEIYYFSIPNFDTEILENSLAIHRGNSREPLKIDYYLINPN